MSQGALIIEEALRIPADVFSLPNFRRWVHSKAFPRQGRFSFIGGEVDIDMSPEEIETHNKVKTDVGAGMWICIRRDKRGELLSDRVLLINEAADLATEPDLTFCSWEGLRSGRVRYCERIKGSRRLVEVTGSPDAIVEIISQNSVRKDTRLLTERYFAAGVLEYWLIDARGATVDFTILRRGKRKYLS